MGKSTYTDYGGRYTGTLEGLNSQKLIPKTKHDLLQSDFKHQSKRSYNFSSLYYDGLSSKDTKGSVSLAWTYTANLPLEGHQRVPGNP